MNIHLFVIGLGPGDPELITLRGLRRLQAASVIFVPRSREGRESLAWQIAAPHVDLTRQRVVDLPLVMAREADPCVEAWEAAAGAMAREIPAKGSAAYLLLGDPSLYGTFAYLAERLMTRRPEVRVEIVPGVHSYSAAAALAGWPLACGEERVAILPAAYEDDPGLIRQWLTEFDTLILLKANKALPRLTPMLREMGLADQTLIAERLGFPDQRVFHGLAAVEGESLNYLSLAIIRKL